MKFHRRFKSGDFGRILIARYDIEQRALIIGNVVLLWDARKRNGILQHDDEPYDAKAHEGRYP